jgi:hypothetical protein
VDISDSRVVEAYADLIRRSRRAVDVSVVRENGGRAELVATYLAGGLLFRRVPVLKRIF